MNVRQAAGHFSLPAAWLRDEALNGRLPALRVGKRLLFDADQLRRALADRASRNVEVDHD